MHELPDGPFALQGRFVIPVTSDPLPDGVIAIDGERIVAVGENTSGRPPIDLGNVAILPGLVNTHTHLQFSDLESPLGAHGMLFPEWIRAVIAGRRQVDPDEAAAKSRAAMQRGALESLQHGVTTIGDIVSSTPDATVDPRYDTVADVTLFHELIGLGADRVEPLTRQITEWVGNAALTKPSWRIGVSPHAPYTVHPDLLANVCRLSAEQRIPVAMHLAESLEELELLAAHSGPFVELLRDVEAWDPSAIPRGIQPLAYLQQLAVADRALVIHGNFLTNEEIQFLAERRETMSVVYCPRTHAYFGHGKYPLSEMLDAGVNVALGTDSRASNPDLNLWEEMRFVARTHPNVSPRQILRMGTQAGAHALGLSDLVGGLAVGRRADLIIFRLPENQESEDVLESLLDSPRVLHGMLVRGGQVSAGSRWRGAGLR